ARSITRPRSALARAADRVGRDARTEPLAERGARELRHAARAFNTMQDRLRRYLDSRTRVLAAMSHDLKTPLTRLRLQVETLDNPPLEVRIGRELDEMEARVRDAGPGIPDAELERVFEPFYRLESSRNRDSGGTGLGLTIARDIAQAHGGTLSLRNLAAGGLEAELLLPRAAGG